MTFSDYHEGAGIIEMSTVIRSREERDQLPFAEKLITVLHNLMSSTNEIHVLLREKILDNIGTYKKILLSALRRAQIDDEFQFLGELFRS